MQVAPLLTRAAQLHHPAARHQALSALYLCARGPIRTKIFSALSAIEQGTTPIEAINALVVSSQVEGAQLASEKLAREAARRLVALEQLDGQAAYVPALFRMSVAPAVRDAGWNEFSRLELDIRQWIVETWRQFGQRLDGRAKDRIARPTEFTDLNAEYRLAAHTFLEDARDAGDIDTAKIDGLVSTGSGFFPKRHLLYVDTGERRVEYKVSRLRDFYALAIGEALERNLCDALFEIRRLVRREGLSTKWGKQRMAIVRRVLPQEPPWVQALANHFFGNQSKSADDFGFVLRAARLLQHVTNNVAAAHGYSHYDLHFSEANKTVHRDRFRKAVIKYGIPYGPLAYAYMRTHYPEINADTLTLQRRPLILVSEEREKVRLLVKHSPSFGEWVYVNRSARDLAMLEAVDMLGFSTTVCTRMEANESYGTLDQLRTLAATYCPHLEPGEALDDILRLILRTFYPRVRHPRLQREPIYIDPHSDGDLNKLRDYAKNPGSSGELIFFLRKRLFSTVEVLARQVGASTGDFTYWETNVRQPAQKYIGPLCRALNISEDVLRQAIGRTKYTPLDRPLSLELRTRHGEIDWRRLKKRPRPVQFRKLVRDLGLDPKELTRQLNRRFSKSTQLSACHFYREDDPIYIATRADERRIAYYAKLGRPSFGEWLFFWRKDISRNWTVLEAAALIGISPQSLGNLERNKYAPSEDRLRRIAVAYGARQEELQALCERTTYASAA
jgi:DNA-binding XRE family transcriptional regulator